MARNDSFFNRLTKLFKSGPAIQRRIKGQDASSLYDTKLIQGNYGYRAPAPFGFGRENSPFSVLGSYGMLDRMARYAEFGEMEYCLHEDTKIAVPGGYKTIKELSKKYGLNEEFVVYSYDHSKKKILPAVGRQARQTRVDHAYKVKFNSGKEIIGTSNHRLMKRDGTYCEIGDLQPGDAMMPFYRRSVSTDRTEGQYNLYQTIYTINREENSYGWTAEHKLLAEFALGRKLAKDEVVHHKNFLAHDNRVENLEVMKAEDHRRLHAEILNGKKWDYKTNSKWIENFKKQHSAWMKENNPAERKDITFERILHWCDTNSYNLYKVARAFDTGGNTIKRKLAAKGFENWIDFAKAYSPGWRSESWNNVGNKNPRYRNDITFGKICNSYSKGMTKKHIAKKLGVSVVPIQNRLKEEGYNTWTDFVSSYENHKVVSIEYYGKIPLYDLTVDGYKNFATDSVISHNTPEIATALDIYCVAGDVSVPLYDGGTKTVKELFDNEQKNFRVWSYDILNNKFVSGLCKKVVKTGEDQKIYKVKFDDESYLRLTENHLVLMVDGTYKKVKNLDENICVQGVSYEMPYIPTKAEKVIISIEEDGQEDVYDLQVEEHHNFAAGINGEYTIIHNSDETVGGDEHGHSFHVFSDNTQVKKALEELFYDVLNVEFNIRMWVRNLVKYGDFFLYNEVLPDAGVINAQPIPVSDIEREEGFDEEDPYAIRFKWLTRGNVYLENWQITHFRILGNDMFLPYGTAVLEPARRIWRQLIMMEDAMLVYRVVRSPERRVFYIDVGNVAPNDVPSYMEAAKATLRSHSVIDKSSGRQDMRYNPLAIDEDYYIPVRGAQSGTKIETLAGGQHVTATEDVTYIQSKLFAALKVPKPYLNYDENLSSKATLAQTDVRFSRTITAIQKIVIAEMTKLAMIHLFAKGFDGEDLINFSLKLSNPSTVALQQKLELWSTKMDIAGAAKETTLVDERWIQKVLLELTDDDIDNINKGLYQDRIKEAQLEQVAFEDENFQPTTTDAFSPSNYDMPGENIPKKQDPEDTAMQPARDIVGIPKNKNQYKINYKKGSTPIKATPFLNRHRKNRKRRVGAGGRSNLSTPDFSAMMNPSKNKSLSDIYDSEYLKNPTKREGVEHKEDNFEESINVNNIKAEPNFTNELKSIFKNLKKSLTVHRKRTGMLTEDFDFEDNTEEHDDSEELLIESVLDDSDNDDSTPKSLKEAFVNNEKPDKQKEDEKEKDELIELEIE